VKIAGTDLDRFDGPARVFEGEAAAMEVILAGEIEPGTVLVIRYEGWSSPEHKRSSRASRPRASRSCSACPAALHPARLRPDHRLPIRHILVRHEQGAGHAAEGYAQVTGRPGVAMVTSGPGATNIVTAARDAYMDSIPIVVITGQVATPRSGPTPSKRSTRPGSRWASPSTTG
jgi:hypothetical protein